MLRRDFLQAGPASALAASVPGGGTRLGFDSYSLNAWGWKDLHLLDYAASLRLDTIQLSSLGDYESLEPAHLAKVRDHARRLGIAIEAGVGCVCPSSRNYPRNQGDAVEYVRTGLRVAHALGSPSLRCFLGSGADRRGELPIEAHMENTVKVFRAVRAQARDLGVKLAIENHAGDMQAREVRTIVEEAGTDVAGACLDTGNPMWVAEDPLVTLEVLHPYVLTTHIRDSVVFEHPRGAAAQWVTLGDGTVDFRRFTQACTALCPRASMQLEIITGRPPQVLPYLEAEFWKAFPKTPASEFARFLALAKSGRESAQAPAAAGEPQEARRRRQKADLERSIEYAQKTLGLGIRWKA